MATDAGPCVDRAAQRRTGFGPDHQPGRSTQRLEDPPRSATDARRIRVPESTQLQHDALEQADCVRVFEDKISSRVAHRPGLAKALDYLRDGDTLCVWKLDRLGRLVKEVLTLADDLREQGIGLRILTGRLAGTYAPSGEGKFFFTMMAAFAELERDMLHERTMTGLAAARAQGRAGGRPAVMDADKVAAATARRARGEARPRRSSTRRLTRDHLPAPA